MQPRNLNPTNQTPKENHKPKKTDVGINACEWLEKKLSRPNPHHNPKVEVGFFGLGLKPDEARSALMSGAVLSLTASNDQAGDYAKDTNEIIRASTACHLGLFTLGVDEYSSTMLFGKPPVPEQREEEKNRNFRKPSPM